MSVNRDFRDLFREFSEAEVRFLVVGAHAVSFYTVPRYTKDLDVWIEPTPENAARAHAALARFGAPLQDLSVDDLCTPGTVFQIGVEPNRIDILTDLAGLKFEQAWQHRAASTYGDIPIFVLGREDLIVNKRAAGRAQDLLDLEWLGKKKG